MTESWVGAARLAALASIVATVVALVAHVSGPVVAQDLVPEWRSVEAGPIAYGAAALLDLPRDRVVLHGGETGEGGAVMPAPRFSLVSDTWGAWSVTGDAPVSSRSGRGLLGSPAIVDPGEDTVLAVCDCVQAGTFELDLATDRWTSVEQAIARNLASASLVYDAAADRAIVFGGREFGIGEIVTATHAYDLSAARTGWQTLPPAPFQLQDQAVAVDAETGHALAFGGQDPEGEPGEALWRLDLSRADREDAWTLLEPSGDGPPPRMGASLTFFAPGLALLFGGYAEGRHLGDLWLLDYTESDAPAWAQLTAAGGPPPSRAAHAAVWDPTAERLLVVGGITGEDLNLSVLGDAWALYPAGVPDLTPTPSATATIAPNGATFLPAVLRRSSMP